MRRAAFVLSFALISACAPKDDAPADDAAMQASSAPTIADFAGTYAMTSFIGTDTVMSTLVLTADGTGSTMTLQGRPGVAVTPSISGDSLVTQTAEYESVLRPGTMVTVRTAGLRQPDGGVRGTMVATYKTADGESVASGTFTGSKAP